MRSLPWMLTDRRPSGPAVNLCGVFGGTTMLLNRAASPEVGLRREGQIDLEVAAKEKDPVDRRMERQVEEMHGAELALDLGGPVGQHVLHASAVRDAERQVEVRPPVSGARRERTELGAGDDPVVRARHLQQPRARGVALPDREHVSTLSLALHLGSPYGRLPAMVPETSLESTEHGLVPKGDGWFVLNAREGRWRHAEGRGAICDLEGEPEFPQLGIHIFVLAPREPMSMYHWEADQEDFLVVAGEALLIVEGEERPLRQWDFVHCPAETKHTIVGAGDGPCVIVAVGARDRSTGPGWGGYTVDETALRHGAGVERETTEALEAYAPVPRREPTHYREGWLPD
jgi:uncharacterized cupin superfamily protein